MSGAYAIINAGGKQHRVSVGEKLKIAKLPGEVGSEVVLKDVLFLAMNGTFKVGNPCVQNSEVAAQIIAQDRGPKLRVFKKKRRKGFHKTIGHRQDYTEVQILDIKG